MIQNKTKNISLSPNKNQVITPFKHSFFREIRHVRISLLLGMHLDLDKLSLSVYTRNNKSSSNYSFSSSHMFNVAFFKTLKT